MSSDPALHPPQQRPLCPIFCSYRDSMAATPEQKEMVAKAVEEREKREAAMEEMEEGEETD